MAKPVVSVVATPKLPRRYRLGSRRFEFELLASGLIETTSGVRIEGSWFSFCVCDELPEGEPHPTTVYVDRSGRPLTPEGEAILNDAVRLQLSVLDCRLPADEVHPDDGDKASAAYWKTTLEAVGLFEELPASGAGGYSAVDLEREFGHRRATDYGEYAPTRARRVRRPLHALSKAEWRRWMRCRLALYFRLPAPDPRIQRITDCLCGDYGWSRWKQDPELTTLFDEYKSNINLQRRIRLLTDSAIGRGMARRKRKPFKLLLGPYVFQFPPPSGRASRAQHKNEPQLTDLGAFIVPGPQFDLRMLAAAIWLWQEHLVRPKNLAGRRLPQAAVATRFKITRRQLTVALSTARRVSCKPGRTLLLSTS